MLKRWLNCLVLGVGMLLLAPTVRGDDEANKEEVKKLQGQWKVVSGLHNGQELELLANLNLKLTFQGDQLTVESETNANFTPQVRTFRVDASTNPKLLDVSETKDFSEKDKIIEGLYVLEGDTLKWCFLMEGDQPAKSNRPSTLESKEGSNTVLITLKRVGQ